jgi:hypothetical protein
MAIVAWHLDQLLGIPESSETLQQKGDAIKLMNMRLHDPNQGAQVNDGIVGAVAVLANFEVSQCSVFLCLTTDHLEQTMNGTKDSSQIHMAGLVKMVGLRGGLPSFESNPVLQRVLTWFVYSFLAFSLY